MSRFDAIRTDRRRTAETAVTATEDAAPARTLGRVGKKAVSGYFSPELSRALHMLALEEDTSLQALLGEAIDDLLRKYGRHPFGER